MAVRLLIVTVPAGAEGRLEDLLESAESTSRWDSDGGAGRVVHALVQADEVEPLMDRLEQAFEGQEGFHLALLPVEALLPREQEDEPKDDPRGTGGEGRPPGRISRAELHSEVVEQLGVTGVFLTMTAISALVASIGMLRDNMAVVIGAMVIAPLLVPNIALALATVLADVELGKRALVANLSGAGTALALAAIVGWVVDVDSSIPALAARSQISLSDLALAVAAGAAGTLALTRGLSGAVIGVMVAVALLPPLVATGLHLGQGHWIDAGRAGLLTAANVIGVNLAAVATLAILGVRPRRFWEAARARRATRWAVAVWVVLLVALAVLFWFLGDRESLERAREVVPL
ncbi:MAG: TIGR00341 family protein [Thermoanaerobaculia bacterium]